MAWGLREVYLLAAGLFQLLLAYLIVRSGQRRTIRAAFGIVVTLGALQTLNLLTKNLGVYNLPAIPRRFVDTAILVTLAYLLAQFPRPLGGERGARWSKRLWLGVLAGWGVLIHALGFAFGKDALVPSLGRTIFHEGAFALIGGLFALHFVPRWFETDEGLLRTQAMFAGVGLAASTIGFGVTDMVGVTAVSDLLPGGLGGGFHLLAAWFVLCGVARVLYRSAKEGEPEAWLFAGLVLLPVGLGVHRSLATSVGAFELGAQLVRPILFALALLRFELVDVPEVERRWAVPASTVFLAALAFLMAVTVFSPEGPDAQQIGPGTALAGVLVVAGLAAVAREPLTRRLAPAAGSTDRSHALDRYRLAVERAHSQSGAAEDLEELRESLGVSEREHELVTALVDADELPAGRSMTPAEPGDLVASRYHVDRELGRGGQGRALAAWDRQEDRQVVLKEVLRPWEEGADERRRALEREVDLAGGIDDPGLATVHGLVEEGPHLYLVRDYVPGPTLDDVIDDEAPLDPDRAARIARAIAESLDHLHERGLLHLDLKPSNVVLRDGRAPVIIDHGTIEQVPDQGTDGATRTLTSSTPPGTLAWMAPEQVLDEPLDGRADVFALGALLYAMRTGDHHVDLDQPTYRVEDEIVRGSPPEDPQTPLDETARACLAREPDGRPVSMSALVDRLARAGDDATRKDLVEPRDATNGRSEPARGP